MSTMPYDFRDVVLVPFPFTNQAATKQRPGVVVSGLAYNDIKPDIVVMAITSQLRFEAVFGEVRIREWQAAGLLRPSAIKPVFATMEQTLVLRALGILSRSDNTALQSMIQEVLVWPR